MQSTPKFIGYYVICTRLKSKNDLKSLNVTHLKTRQVVQKKRYPKKAEEKGGGHIDPTPGEIGLSLCGNIKVKEIDTITFTKLGQTLKVC